MVSGLFWPLNNSSPAVKLLAFVSPLYLPLKTAEAQLISGQNNYFKIIHAVICIIFWTVLSFTAFIIKFKNKINFII